MHPWARSSLFFAAGFWTALVVIGAVAIYGFGYFETKWGRGPSLQVHIWIATLGAVVSLFPAGFGFRLGTKGGTAPGPLLAATCGAAVVLLFWVIGLLLPDRIMPGALTLLLIVFAAFGTACIASVVKNRLAAGPSNNRWRGP
jgi:hypothetical protein